MCNTTPTNIHKDTNVLILFYSQETWKSVRMASDLVKKKKSTYFKFLKPKIHFLLSAKTTDPTQKLAFNSKIALLLRVR